MEQLSKAEVRRLRLINRNKAVRKEYERLSLQKYKTVKLFTEEAKISKIADKFFLSEKTVEDIIFNRLKYEN